MLVESVTDSPYVHLVGAMESTSTRDVAWQRGGCRAATKPSHRGLYQEYIGSSPHPGGALVRVNDTYQAVEDTPNMLFGRSLKTRA